MFRANLQRTGVYDARGPAESPRVKWRFDAGGLGITQPLLAGDTLYFGCRSDTQAGHLHALDAQTGEERWRAAPGRGCLQVDGDHLYCASSYAVYRLDRASGEKRRLWSEPDGLWGSPEVVDGVLYAGGLDGLYAVDLESGEPRWRFATGGYGPTAAAFGDGLLYFGSYGGRLYAVGADDGRARWTFRASERVTEPPALVEGCLYFPCEHGDFHAVDAAKGKAVWTFPLSEVATAAAVTHDVVCFGTWDGRFVALERNSGKLLWTFKTAGEVPSSPSIAGSVVYFGDGDFHAQGGRLYALDLHGGRELWRFETTPRMWAEPIISGGVVYAVSGDGCLHALA